MANPRGQQRDKPFRDALRMEIAEAADDPQRLRRIARSLLAKAEQGDVPAIKEVADRLDGKVPQAVVGDDEHDPVRMEAKLSDMELARQVAFILARGAKKTDDGTGGASVAS